MDNKEIPSFELGTTNHPDEWMIVFDLEEFIKEKYLVALASEVKMWIDDEVFSQANGRSHKGDLVLLIRSAKAYMVDLKNVGRLKRFPENGKWYFQ